MTDIRLKEYSSLEAVTFDWLLRDNGLLDERDELATLVRVALGSDALARSSDVLPELDSTDRRGWWGDLEAEEIWDGWPLGTKAWLLSRAKITNAPSSEGSTLERARQYTRNALQPLIDKGMASAVHVSATLEDVDRITVEVVIFRGPQPEVELRYQMLWDTLGDTL